MCYIYLNKLPKSHSSFVLLVFALFELDVCLNQQSVLIFSLKMAMISRKLIAAVLTQIIAYLVKEQV